MGRYFAGTLMPFPYLTLQALGLGLTIEDISIIYGVVPILSFMAAPVAGFVGDKVGYKPVIITSILALGATSTSFHYMPRYKETSKMPYAVLVTSEGYAMEPYSISSVAWPLCDVEHTNNGNENSKL